MMHNFSVLLSIYNKENPIYFNISLSSILEKQTLKPNEIIIVKDGPLTSELDEIILNWKERYPLLIKIISIPKNVGLGNALNEGINHCSYDWVFRMDTDDICLPDRFEKQVIFIKNNPAISLLGSSIEEFDEEISTSLGCKIPPSSNENIKNYIKKRNPFNHMTVAFKKDIVNSVGGYKHHLYMEDYNLWLRIISAGYVTANLTDILVKVRAGNSMVQRRKGFNYIKSEFLLAKLKVKLNIDNPISATKFFILRSIPRLLPTLILSKIYTKLRNKGQSC